MTPFGDGFQQIQDPCAAQSNFIELYNETELYQSWQIFQDPVTGYKLHLFQFDGSPVAPQFQVSPQPNMLPTQLLRNVTPGFTTQDGFVSTGNGKSQVLAASTGGAVRQRGETVGMLTAVSAIVGVGTLLMLAL